MSIRTTIEEKVIPQFANPRGFYGRIAGRIMATRDTNVERNLWVARTLDVQPDARILEIGHGPGIAIEQIWPTLDSGTIVGVEISGLMNKAAARRNREGIRSGRVELRIGDSAALPPDLTAFDLVFGVNASMFWPDPQAAIEHLAGRLAPGGELVLVYMPPPTATETAADVSRQIEALFQQAGLTDVRQDEMDFDPPAVATRAFRPI